MKACAAAADELAEQRRLADALEAENSALRERLATKVRIASLLEQSNDARAAEAAALRDALAAKDQTIAAKDAVTDILIGAAVFAILK